VSGTTGSTAVIVLPRRCWNCGSRDAALLGGGGGGSVAASAAAALAFEAAAAFALAFGSLLEFAFRRLVESNPLTPGPDPGLVAVFLQLADARLRRLLLRRPRATKARWVARITVDFPTQQQRFRRIADLRDRVRHRKHKQSEQRASAERKLWFANARHS